MVYAVNFDMNATVRTASMMLCANVRKMIIMDPLKFAISLIRSRMMNTRNSPKPSAYRMSGSFREKNLPLSPTMSSPMTAPMMQSSTATVSFILQLHRHGGYHQEQPEHHEGDVEHDAGDPLHREEPGELPDAAQDMEHAQEADDGRDDQARPAHDVAVRDLDEGIDDEVEAADRDDPPQQRHGQRESPPARAAAERVQEREQSEEKDE